MGNVQNIRWSIKENILELTVTKARFYEREKKLIYLIVCVFFFFLEKIERLLIVYIASKVFEIYVE